MANKKQLAVLKKGAGVWNEWKKQNPDQEIDLSSTEFIVTNLAGENLVDADLSGASLVEANLSGANLSYAILVDANLHNVDLTDAKLPFANLILANLSDALLCKANLSEAVLQESIFNGTDLTGANFSASQIGDTSFSSLDLSVVIGLEKVIHKSPSHISTDTLVRSKGRIPEVFLRGCGLSDWEIEQAKLYNPDLTNEEISNIQYKIYDLRSHQALQISPLFISYSHLDSGFVDKIESKLNQKGIRFWRDIHEMKAGRMEKQIDLAIRQNPTVLLVLSEHSLSSDWVEHEVRTARGLEKELGRDTLCPVALDDSWKSSRWPKRIAEQIMEYNILDFSAWEDDVKFEGMFRKLIDGLELFYKG